MKISKRKILKAAAFVLAAVMAVNLYGCGHNGDVNPADSHVKSDTAVQNYPVGSYERKAIEKEASGSDDSDGEVYDFGNGSIFGGIQIQSDENGEIVCAEENGMICYAIDDKRFSSYRAFARFVRRNSDEAEVRRLSSYFGEIDGELYFIIGAHGRNVKDITRYYDSVNLTVNVLHTAESRKKYGIARSEICFAHDNGAWSLVGLTVLDS